MNHDLFWLSDEQFERISLHLPCDTRGKPRVDDRRVISGIVHVLKSGGRWVDAPPEYGPRKTLYNRYGPRGGERRLGTPLSHSFVGRRSARPRADRQLGGEEPPLRLGRKRGAKTQAIRRSRGGRTTMIHALTDTLCRPIAFLLTGSQVADCTAASTLLERLPKCRVLHADKGYDSNSIPRSVEALGTMPNIPPKVNLIWKNCFSPL